MYIYILYLSIATTHLPKARRHPRHRKSPGACLWTPLFGSSNSLHLAEQLAVLQSAAYVGFTARNLPFADGLFIRLHGDFGDGLLMFISWVYHNYHRFPSRMRFSLLCPCFGTDLEQPRTTGCPPSRDPSGLVQVSRSRDISTPSPKPREAHPAIADNYSVVGGNLLQLWGLWNKQNPSKMPSVQDRIPEP